MVRAESEDGDMTGDAFIPEDELTDEMRKLAGLDKESDGRQEG